MNEVTWKRVMDWEQLHCDTCPLPKLLKFQGKPHDLRWGRHCSPFPWWITAVIIIRLQPARI
jgi:hypothetical protein